MIPRKPANTADTNAPRPGGETGESGSILAEIRGGGGGDAPETPRGRRARKYSGTTVLFGTVLVLSAASLFAMRKFGMNSGMTWAVQKIDYDAERALRGTDAEHQRILNDLSKSLALGQEHSLDRLPKNPFELATDVPKMLGPGMTPEQEMAERLKRHEDDLRKRTEARKAELDKTLSGLELHSVLLGSSPLARINDRMYRVGDVIGEVFVLTAIQGRSVNLVADGKTFVVEMRNPEEGQGPRGGLRPPQPRR